MAHAGVFPLVRQGSAVSSGGLVADGPEQRQHHVADHPAERQGGSASSGGRRLHAPGQTNSDLMGVKDHRFQSVAGSKLRSLLKCLQTEHDSFVTELSTVLKKKTKTKKKRGTLVVIPLVPADASTSDSELLSNFSLNVRGFLHK